MSPTLCIGLSHSPLKAFVNPPNDKRANVESILSRARGALAKLQPDLIVIFFPDHFNGFFFDLMPPFCVGAAGRAIGDYDSPAGPLRINEKLAQDCAQYVLDQGVDVSLSYRMVVDHGLAQPLSELAGGLETYEILPIFVNSVAPPFAPMERVIKLGTAVGEFLSGTGKRIAYIGSGGLSHDPPLPRLHSATPEQKEMLIAGRNLTPEQRAARQQRVIAAGTGFAKEGGAALGMRDLNREWDTEFMARLAAQDFEAIAQMGVAETTRYGGNSAHEVRTWVAAFSAMKAGGRIQSAISFTIVFQNGFPASAL